MSDKFLPDAAKSLDAAHLTGGASSRLAGPFLDQEITRARNITRALEIAEDVVGGVALFAAGYALFVFAGGMQ